MNVPTIELDPKVAREEFLSYKRSLQDRHDDELDAIMRGYREAAKGRQLLLLPEVIKGAGVDERGYPKLAICRADERWCRVEIDWDGALTFIGLKDHERGWGEHRSHKRRVRLPQGTVANGQQLRRRDAMVPLVPPQYRPRHALSNYHILFEAEWEPVPPRDPFLLKKVAGDLFVILAHWDLTEVERAVLTGRLR